MATTVDLKVGMNLTIGGIPVLLEAEVDNQGKKTIYTFDGCIQDAHINLSDFLKSVGAQFSVNTLFPQELDLSADIDYIAGQVIYSKPKPKPETELDKEDPPTTQMGISARFELSVGDKTIGIQFYADSIFSGSSKAESNLGTTPYVLGAAFETDLKFENLPLVGSIPVVKDLVLTKLGFSYCNQLPDKEKQITFSIPQVKSSPNPLYTRTGEPGKGKNIYSIESSDKADEATLGKSGFSLTAILTNDKNETLSNFELPLSPPSPPKKRDENQASALFRNETALSSFNTESSSSSIPVHWININKTFGPVKLQKIGLNYSQGEASFGISAGFSVTAFSLDLQGLTIKFPMPLPGSKAGDSVSFDLEGLGFDFSNGPLTLGGAFLKVKEDGLASYYGEVIAQVSSFGFKALGGYSSGNDKNPSSFFLYANISVPLGGPPFFSVTGLAGGLGINRSLRLPTLDELPDYILLPHNAPRQGGSASETIKTAMPGLQKYFENKPGEYWVAVGIEFSSFEMVKAFAVLTVAFGVDFQIALIGSCAMTLPTGTTAPVAYVEVDFMASFSAASGIFAIQGKLSPASYLYGGFCRLQGGFAFYIWLTGEHQGDFVVTLGGYHPAYKAPAHYPTVPRLGIAFGLGPFQVSGEAYFALTPAMMMAGLNISATWQTGAIKAWFHAGIDILLVWAPFHYQAKAYVLVGCSVDLWLFTLHVQAGANLIIWGPSFGGKATVDLDIITFTITFGSQEQIPPPVGWDTFKANFLPPNTTPVQKQQNDRSTLCALSDTESTPVSNIVKASVSSGLITTDQNGCDWILDPNHFVIMTNSAVPANHGIWADKVISNTIIDYNGDVKRWDSSKGPYLAFPANAKRSSDKEVWNPTLGIAPMKLSDVTSTQKISLKRDNVPVNRVQVQPLLQDSCAALWRNNPPNKPSVSDQAMCPATLVGFQITPVKDKPEKVSAVPLLDLLFAQGSSTGFCYTTLAVDTSYKVQSSIDEKTQGLNIEVSAEAKKQKFQNQDFILGALAEPWVVSQRASILDDLNGNGFFTFTKEQINVINMASRTALVDWPMVKLLGGISCA